MKKTLSTSTNNTTALIVRLALGIVVFPHGAQKLLGWYGGGKTSVDGVIAGINKED